MRKKESMGNLGFYHSCSSHYGLYQTQKHGIFYSIVMKNLEIEEYFFGATFFKICVILFLLNFLKKQTPTFSSFFDTDMSSAQLEFSMHFCIVSSVVWYPKTSEFMPYQLALSQSHLHLLNQNLPSQNTQELEVNQDDFLESSLIKSNERKIN